MSRYKVNFASKAEDDLECLFREDSASYRKAISLIGELYEHPRTGTGKPEQLKGDRSGQWSRRISKKHRLIYRIYDTEVVVLVIAAYGHYDDK